MAHHTDALLSIKQINKEFSGVRVLNDISIDINRGEVFGILGENGAGKSTLLKIICGVYTPTSGTIILKGTPASITSPMKAIGGGLSTRLWPRNANRRFAVGLSGW